jgi:putative DNA-invertase from lambdoid prophage Rac
MQRLCDGWVLTVFAEFEREILQERVRAGLADARPNGKPPGRAPTAGVEPEESAPTPPLRSHQGGIARQLKIGRTSVRVIPASHK